MRHAHTITDMADLITDFAVTVLLTDIATVEFMFPTTTQEKEAIKSNQDWADVKYGVYQNPTPSIEFRRKVTYVIRSLVGNPRFMRLTSFAGQLSSFRIFNNKEDSRYGNIKTRKKAKENLHIVFEKQCFAKRFFKDVKWLLSSRAIEI